MKFKAVLKTDSGDAVSVASALEVDNMKLEGLKVGTKAEGNTLVTEMESNRISTLINTLDDIICCQIMAERIIT